ncbi:hypothetical protein CEXT_391411 [Caerostris extrusa]|uniref:Uncharacterized protein n=1 Tax=Caerostris extrusa TaxID=172846 RepID=A0AAV4UHU8_CAEEX|nr:hypothetical protein CEXT_391411 [Caerostris extrusa]
MKQKILKLGEKRRLEKRLKTLQRRIWAGPPSFNPSVNKIAVVQKWTADPIKHEHENALRRKRRAKKIQKKSSGPSPSSKRR